MRVPSGFNTVPEATIHQPGFHTVQISLTKCAASQTMGILDFFLQNKGRKGKHGLVDFDR